MYLTLPNGEREITGEFWKPATRYLIERGKEKVRLATTAADCIKGFIWGFITGGCIMGLIYQMVSELGR